MIRFSKENKDDEDNTFVLLIITVACSKAVSTLTILQDHSVRRCYRPLWEARPPSNVSRGRLEFDVVCEKEARVNERMLVDSCQGLC
jgi:hypothetical protein